MTTLTPIDIIIQNNRKYAEDKLNHEVSIPLDQLYHDYPCKWCDILKEEDKKK